MTTHGLQIQREIKIQTRINSHINHANFFESLHLQGSDYLKIDDNFKELKKCQKDGRGEINIKLRYCKSQEVERK